MEEIRKLDEEEKRSLNSYALKIIDYRRTGISLNHIIGCPINCAYCVRHFWGNFDMKQPHLICSDEEAVKQLVAHKMFIPNDIPIQFLHKATDPFLETVKPHTFNVLKQLDDTEIKNIVMLITRLEITEKDLEFLESLKYIRVTIFFTFSGIEDPSIEPFGKKHIIDKNVLVMDKRNKVKFVQYWRPIVHGWNDDLNTIENVLNYSKHFDAMVVKGLRLRPQNYAYIKERKIDLNAEIQEKKIFAEATLKLINQVKAEEEIEIPIFRKTSCAIAHVNRMPDYNLRIESKIDCTNCSIQQRRRCLEYCSFKLDKMKVYELEERLQKKIHFDEIISGKIEVSNLSYEEKLFAQHFLKMKIV